MDLEHSFTVPVTVEQAWDVLRDIERIGPCIPGASIDSVDGDEFSGKVKVKVGAMQVTYKGSARFAQLDQTAHQATIEARGQEARGAGTAQATVTATLTGRGDHTEVRMVTSLAITGRVAQFGRGTMAEVGAKLIGQFADCLAGELGAGSVAAPPQEESGTPQAAAELPPAAPAAEPAARPGDTPIDLLDVAGAPVAKRLAPIAAVLLLLALVLWWRRRHKE